MRTIIKIKDVLVKFFINYFWGIVTGACVTSGFMAAYKIGDSLGNTENYLETAVIRNAVYNLIDALHTIISVYWEYMGKVDIIILIITIILLFLMGLFGYSPNRRKYL